MVGTPIVLRLVAIDEKQGECRWGWSVGVKRVLCSLILLPYNGFFLSVGSATHQPHTAPKEEQYSYYYIMFHTLFYMETLAHTALTQRLSIFRSGLAPLCTFPPLGINTLQQRHATKPPPIIFYRRESCDSLFNYSLQALFRSKTHLKVGQSVGRLLIYPTAKRPAIGSCYGAHDRRTRFLSQ